MDYIEEGFTEWLEQQCGRGDRVNDVAWHVRFDDDWPAEGNYRTYYQYVEHARGVFPYNLRIAMAAYAREVKIALDRQMKYSTWLLAQVDRHDDTGEFAHRVHLNLLDEGWPVGSATPMLYDLWLRDHGHRDLRSTNSKAQTEYRGAVRQMELIRHAAEGQIERVAEDMLASREASRYYRRGYRQGWIEGVKAAVARIVHKTYSIQDALESFHRDELGAWTRVDDETPDQPPSPPESVERSRDRE
jgi:hypothetical protein